MSYPLLSAVLFYTFAVAALLSAIGVVALRNPVSSALSMALCFGFTAAIFFNMGASFLGIAQIIVYAGAILVLFLFITMMLDVKSEERQSGRIGFISPVLAVIVVGIFAGMIVQACLTMSCCTLPELHTAEQGGDATLLGRTLFSQYNIPFVILGFALLAGTIGAVAVGRKLRKD